METVSPWRVKRGDPIPVASFHITGFDVVMCVLLILTNWLVWCWPWTASLFVVPAVCYVAVTEWRKRRRKRIRRFLHRERQGI